MPFMDSIIVLSIPDLQIINWNPSNREFGGCSISDQFILSVVVEIVPICYHQEKPAAA